MRQITIDSEDIWVTRRAIGNHIDFEVFDPDLASDPFQGTVTVRARTGEGAYRVLARYQPSDITENGGDTMIRHIYPSLSNVELQVGVATGDYTSGSIVVTI